MESFHIHEGKLDDAVMVSANVPEFDDPYEIPEYSKRLNSTKIGRASCRERV